MITSKYEKLIERMSLGDPRATISYQCDVWRGAISLEEAALIDLHVNLRKHARSLEKLEKNVNAC